MDGMTHGKKHPDQGRATPDAALLSYALDHVREAAFLMSDTGQFVYVNSEACRRLGYTANELLALTVFDIDPLYPRTQWHEELQARKRNRDGRILETSHRAKDGRTYPVEIHASYIEYNNRDYILSLVHDIGKRKEAEAQLRKREQEFRTLAENSPDNIARYDREGRYLFFNQRLRGRFDWDPEGAKGLTVAELFPGGEYAGYQAMLMRCMETNATVEMEFQVPNTDEVHLIRFSPEYDEDGQVIGALMIGRDITAYKESQHTLWQQESELTANKNALTVLLDHSRHAEDKIRENMQASLEKGIIPCLDLLENYVTGNPAAKAALQLTRESIHRATLPLVKKLTSAPIGLSPRELQIAHMIARGRPTKEIAASLNLALGTVEFYRDHIRRKLGIKNKKTNLRTYLLNFDQ
jgi:PAS domain S-box-containing protein